MALTVTNRLPLIYGSDFKDKIRHAFDLVMQAPWRSSGLNPDNPFTTSIVLRAAGFLSEAGILEPGYAQRREHRTRGNVLRSLAEISQAIADKAPAGFQIERGRLPSATAAYWFVDGVDRSKINLSSKSWAGVFSWADATLLQNLAKVTSREVSTMDPVEMIMAASLCARLRKLALNSECGVPAGLLHSFKSHVVFDEALRLLFERQDASGLWHKYFELFSYRDEGGSNYCFTFEMLEAVLHEFGSSHGELLFETPLFDGIAAALNWCRLNRKQQLYDRVNYYGWNSAGQPIPLSKDIPESWATAVVHMFFAELGEQVAYRLRERHMAEYKARPPVSGSADWDTLLKIPLTTNSTNHESIQELLFTEIALPAMALSPTLIRKVPLRSRRFVLLFGPPGTGKTELVRAFANKLGWPLVELNPSHFLTRGNIFQATQEIFDDLVEMSAAVVFFDEFDGFVMDRQDPKIDPSSRFLTTMMLPKLNDLRESGKVIFFAATNHRQQVDAAISRFGRFDAQLCMSPPTWSEKVAHLQHFTARELNIATQELFRRCLEEITARGNVEQLETLNLLTFAETKSFLTAIAGTFTQSDFSFVPEGDFWSKVAVFQSQMTLSRGSSRYEEFMSDRKMSKLA